MRLTGLRRFFVVPGIILMMGLVAGGARGVRADELDNIAKTGVLKIGLFEDLPPFASAGPDLKLQGYDIDVSNALAKALGVKAEFVGVTGPDRIPLLQAHKINIVLSTGKTPEREKVIDFTDAYAPYFIAVWGPKSIAVASPGDLVGKSVALPRGTQEDSSLTAVAPAGTNIQRYNDYDGVISAFFSGQAQLMVLGNTVGASIVAKHPETGLEEKLELLNAPSHIGLLKNESRLLQKLNNTIVAMRKDGTLNEISKKWLLQPLPSDF